MQWNSGMSLSMSFTGYIRLEKKSKINGLCSKLATSITRERCDNLLLGDRAFLKESKNALFIELYCKMEYQQLRPKTIIEYTREVYVFPADNSRITIDSNIRTGIFSTDFFNHKTKIVISRSVCDVGITWWES